MQYSSWKTNIKNKNGQKSGLRIAVQQKNVQENKWAKARNNDIRCGQRHEMKCSHEKQNKRSNNEVVKWDMIKFYLDKV